MNYSIRPFMMVDLKQLNVGAIERDLLEGFTLNDFCANDFYPGMAVSIFDQDHILGCLGVIPKTSRVVQGWALFSDEIRDRPIVLNRAVIRCLNLFERLIDYDFLFVTVAASFPKGAAWLERLGFIFDHEIKNYGPNNQKYYRYRK